MLRFVTSLRGTIPAAPFFRSQERERCRLDARRARYNIKQAFEAEQNRHSQDLRRSAEIHGKLETKAAVRGAD